MISFPASYLLLAFVAVGLILLVMIFIHLYHGYRFGRHDPLTMGVNTFFVVAVVAVITFTVMLLLPVDWSGEFTVSSPAPAGVPNLNIPNSAEDLPSILPLE